MTEKSIVNVKTKIKKQMRILKRSSTNQNKCESELQLYNSIVRGIHNYYGKATSISEDLHYLNWHTKYFVRTRLKNVLSFSDIKDDITKEVIGKAPNIRGKPILEIGNIKYTPIYCSNKEYNYFESNSRKFIHKNLGIDNLFVLELLLKIPVSDESVEFNDNVLSKFCAQLGKYAFTNELMFDINNINAIKINENKPGKYDNVIIVNEKIKNLLRIREVDDIIEISNLKRGITKMQLEKINKIRKENSLPLIS